MAQNSKYYIVEASALPEVFVKVAEAKRLLSIGEAATVNEATQKTGISRSAFYKYRDAVLPFKNMMSGRVVTFQLLLHDEPGTLANLLNTFTDSNANIMTINSIMPSNGSSIVTISAETMDLTVQLEDLLRALRQQKGVVKAEILAG
jgi:chorismate mutase